MARAQTDKQGQQADHEAATNAPVPTPAVFAAETVPQEMVLAQPAAVVSATYPYDLDTADGALVDCISTLVDEVNDQVEQGSAPSLEQCMTSGANTARRWGWRADSISDAPLPPPTTARGPTAPTALIALEDADQDLASPPPHKTGLLPALASADAPAAPSKQTRRQRRAARRHMVRAELPPRRRFPLFRRKPDPQAEVVRAMALREQHFHERIARIERGKQWQPDGVIHAVGRHRGAAGIPLTQRPNFRFGVLMMLVGGIALYGFGPDAVVAQGQSILDLVERKGLSITPANIRPAAFVPGN